MNHKEGDIHELVKNIFSKPPEPPNSICISFDNYTLKETFEDILTFLVEGLKIKYANEENKVDLYNMTDEQMQHINNYMNSIGLTLNLQLFNIVEWLFDKSRTYIPYNILELTQNTKLPELKQVFLVHDKACLVSFDFITIPYHLHL
jgi:hypothetical protein